MPHPHHLSHAPQHPPDLHQPPRLPHTPKPRTLNRVFEQAPVAIAVLCGPDLIFDLANPAWQNLFPERDLTGLPIDEAFPELLPADLAALRTVLATGEAFVAHERLIPLDRAQSGHPAEFFFTFACQPLVEPPGAVTGLVIIAVDVTPHVIARRNLEKVNRELEEFAYMASHDLQEPLRMVNTYSQLLIRQLRKSSPEADHHGRVISQGILRMEALITDLLVYSRSSQHDEAPVGIAPLPKALSEALLMLTARIEENAALVTSDPLPAVRGNTQQLTRVFQNVLSNALKYCNPTLDPEIHVSAVQIGAEWTISIQDNGIGFDPANAEVIFGLFKRLHQADQPGTGLGLAICRRIVEGYGGRMWAEGRPGDGATFYFTLLAA